MIVSDAIRKCVAFVAARKKHDYKIGGTAFFIIHPIEGSDGFSGYAVTARHVIEDAFENSIDAIIYLRVNTIDNRAEWIPTAAGDWEYHDDGVTDVAIASIEWSDSDIETRFDHLFIPSEASLTNDLIERMAVLPGEDLYFPGLYVRCPGDEANIPILRTGTIAAIGHQLVSTPKGPARGYLAEIRSIGGHSGSPVFVHINSLEKVWTLKKTAHGIPEDSFVKKIPLLGLVHGHFETSGVNEGIAVIVPADEILHVLNQPRLIAQREKDRENLRTTKRLNDTRNQHHHSN